MALNDLKLRSDTTLQITEKDFKLGEQRILAISFSLLLALQGSRPRLILEVKFGNFKVRNLDSFCYYGTGLAERITQSCNSAKFICHEEITPRQNQCRD